MHDWQRYDDVLWKKEKIIRVRVLYVCAGMKHIWESGNVQEEEEGRICALEKNENGCEREPA